MHCISLLKKCVLIYLLWCVLLVKVLSSKTVGYNNYQFKNVESCHVFCSSFTGTVKACVLIENVLSSYEMEEILYELRDHSLGLNCGIWDYAASIICKFGLYKKYDCDSGSIKDLLQSTWEGNVSFTGRTLLQGIRSKYFCNAFHAADVHVCPLIC
jgi:hypothetical protein